MKEARDNKQSITESYLKLVEESNERLTKLINDKTSATDKELHDFMKIDQFPPERIEHLRKTLAIQLKTELCNMSPLLKKSVKLSERGTPSAKGEADEDLK